MADEFTDETPPAIVFKKKSASKSKPIPIPISNPIKSDEDSDSEFEAEKNNNINDTDNIDKTIQTVTTNPESQANSEELPIRKRQKSSINLISSKPVKSTSEILQEAEDSTAALQAQFDSVRTANKSNVTMLMEEIDAVGNKLELKHDVNKPKWTQPMRLTNNVRIMSRMDYQPDVCKDYKETGYCGFGDSCKFLHDRTEIKQSWQLDKEWDEKQKKLQEKNNPKSTTNSDLPFACLICRKPFEKPVKTKCNHYFCEKCAFKQVAKSSKCFVCKKETNGIFSVATDIINRQNNLKRKAETNAEDSDNEEETTK